MQSRLTTAVCLALLALVSGWGELEAQCNICINGCGGLGTHYDACDMAFQGWGGGCIEGCKLWSSCSIHPDDCGTFSSLAQVDELAAAGAWELLAMGVIEGRGVVDVPRAALFLRACGGEDIVGQYPLAPAQLDRLLVAIASEQRRLLAEVLQ